VGAQLGSLLGNLLPFQTGPYMGGQAMGQQMMGYSGDGMNYVPWIRAQSPAVA
jgi:hypothetical protein